MNDFLNIYPWTFWFFMTLGPVAQAYRIHKTKKTEGLSLLTFVLAIVASTLFGWTTLMTGKSGYPFVLGNSLAVITTSYILYYILRNKGIKGALPIALTVFASSMVLLILGTINYIDEIKGSTPLIDIDSIPEWIKTVVPTFGGITSASIFLPQLIKIIKTKETKNLSYLFLFFFMTYLVNVDIFWLSFWIHTGEWSLGAPSVILTTLGVIVQTTVIILKYTYEK